MQKIKENCLKKTLSVLIVTALFFFTRLIRITSLPVFADEAIYIRWSQIIKNVETLRFIPLTDGKQPLFMWLTVPFLSIVSNPLIAGRLVSVLSGFSNIVFLFLTTAILLSKSTKQSDPIKHIFSSIQSNFYPSLLASLIYILLPFSLFFDRLATPDNLLSAFSLIAIFLTILQSKYYRLDISLILATSLGLAWLTKSPALYFIALSTAFLFLNLYIKTNNHKLRSLFHILIVPTISFIIYNFLKLGPQFHMIAARNKDYIWPLSEILKHPLDPLKPHLMAAFSVYKYFLSWPFIILFPISLILSIKNKKYKTITPSVIYVLLTFLAPLLATTSMAKVFTGRYILFTITPLILILIILLSNSFKTLKLPGFLIPIIFILIFTPNIIKANKIIFSPFDLNLPDTEAGYINDWTAGWGLKDISDYLIDRSKHVNVIVGTEGTFGTLPDGLQIYTDGVPRLTIIGQGIHLSQIPAGLLEANQYGDEVYLLINSDRHFFDVSELNKMEPISTYIRPDQTQLILYKLKSIKPLSD